MIQNKKLYAFIGVLAGFILVLGLLWYYQSQGVLKIFPSQEDRRIKNILKIDESKFSPAQGLPAETYNAEIKKLYEQKEKVLANPSSAQVWFDFAFTKQFLNDHEGAALAWEKSFELQELNFVTALNLGNTYQYFLKDFHKAEFYYLAALKLRSDYTSAYEGLLDIYRYNLPEKQGEVEPLLVQAIKNDPANQLPYFVALADFFFTQGNLEKALKYFDSVGQLSNESALSLQESFPQYFQ